MSRDRKHICVVVMVIFSTIFLGVDPAARCEEKPEAGYDPGGRRDPFVPLIGVSPKDTARSGVWSVLSIDDVFLQGVVINPDGTRSAVINGEVISEGETIDQVLIKSVGENKVMIEISGRTHELELYEEN